jgi:hypothetical protein
MYPCLHSGQFGGTRVGDGDDDGEGEGEGEGDDDGDGEGEGEGDDDDDDDDDTWPVVLASFRFRSQVDCGIALALMAECMSRIAA